MGIVSFAQNFEDVILWRALGHICEGTYVDVGAHHPDIDSVSRAFFDRGWRGVHVEPGPTVAQLLREKRPGDIVVQAIVSEKRGIQPFYETPGGGLSTADKDVADFHREQENAPISPTTAISLTLDEVLDHVPGDEIHWLKIDVEGFERQVLLSWKESVRRPWVIVVEATYPKTRIPTSSHWQDIILSKGYSLVYDDGLNRFYLSDQHEDLRTFFVHPPNIFDEFQINPSGASAFSRDMKAFSEGEISARDTRIAQLEQELEGITKRLSEAEEGRARDWIVHENLEQFRESLAARAEQLFERVLIRESDIAEHKRLLIEQARQVDWLSAQLAAQEVRWPNLPWPLRILFRSAGQQRAASRLGSDAMTLNRLLALSGDDFLRQAYRIVLGRDSDEAGMTHYREKFAKGRDKTWVLTDLARSREACHRESGDDLAYLPDEEFIDLIYLRLLGRAADPVGKQHYLAKMNAGDSRKNVMRSLRRSMEGRRHQAGIAEEIDFLLRRRSLLGWRTWFRSTPL